MGLLQDKSILEDKNKPQQRAYVSVERESSEGLDYTAETWLVTTLKLQFFMRNAESHSSAKSLCPFLFTCTACAVLLCVHQLIHTMVEIRHSGVQHSSLQSSSRLRTLSSKAEP